MQDSLAKAEAVVRARFASIPENAVVLGSGLGPLAEELTGAQRLPVSEIPGHPLPRVEGHAGMWVNGTLGGAPVLALQGRSHFYEGYNMQEVTFATALLHRLGVRRLIVTNASGTATKRLHPGELMLITGIINLFWHQPVWNADARRSEPLDPKLMQVAERVAREQAIPLQRGVLAPSSGPSYETPAEIRMVQRFGGDAACMSTVPEILTAGQLGLRVLGISCITNYGSGLTENSLNHQEVIDTANLAAATFRRLVSGILDVFHREKP
jgi:purine-nucleoside phosphorylase